MTKIIKQNQIDDTTILEIANALNTGKLVIFPTDTVYGIGTNAYDEAACKRIYEVKGRPEYKPLIVLISDISMLKSMVEEISPLEQKLVDAFWPGPLTIKFKKKDGILPAIVSAKDAYVGVRWIKEGLVYQLIHYANVPIVAPSANLSGSMAGIKIENIINEFRNKADYILDCGDIDSDIVSTIVEVKEEKIIVIREGKITKEALAQIAPLKEE